MSSTGGRTPRAALRSGGKRAIAGGLTLGSVARHRSWTADEATVVLGSGRSGTTWLQELVTTLDGTYPVYEPMRPDEDPRVAPLVPATGYARLAPGQPAPAFRSWWDEVLSGRRLTKWSASQAEPRSFWTADRTVVKEIRANRIAGWLAGEFPRTPMLVIVRHPCAVVASILRSPGLWDAWGHADVVAPLAGIEPEAALAAAGPDRGRHTWLAALWAADLAAVLRDTTPEQALLVTYESLVREPEPVLEAVFGRLGHAVPDAARERLRRPSATANPDAAVRSRRDPLAAWTDQLDPVQRDEVLEVVAAFGIDAYGADLLPDLDALRRSHRHPDSTPAP